MHRALPVRVALFRRNLISDMTCLVCEENFETVEHLFFQCEEWFMSWLGSAPDKFAILESISILWTIWCCPNQCGFRQFQNVVLHGVKDAYYLYQMICRLQQQQSMVEDNSFFSAMFRCCPLRES